MPDASSLSGLFAAVSDPQRLRIVELLHGGDRSVNELVRELGLPQPQTSKHLKLLREAGLVEVQVAGKHRIYSLRAEPLRQVYDWSRHFENLWNERFDQLDELLVELKRERNL